MLLFVIPNPNAAPSPKVHTFPNFVLHVSPLTYHYPDNDHPALRDITFSLNEGEVLLLAGGTESGKTTLCYALAGFAPHFFHGTLTGDVILDGRSLRGTSLGEWVQQVGLVLQNPFNQITGARATVFEEVAFGLENLGVPRAEMGERVQAILEQLDIASLAERAPSELSGGQVQRVALASILVLRPRLLVLDEPTAQLDPAATEEVFTLLHTLVEQGSTIVLATHHLAAAATLATRALVLHKGRIVREGPAPEVLGDPRLTEWHVEPPIYAPLAARLGVPAPLPVTLPAAQQALTTHPLRLTDAPAPWPFAAVPPLPPASPVLPTPVVVEGIYFRYPSGTPALRGASLRLEPGKVTALVGANGAGKSTLARTLNGLLRPDQGTLHVGDWRVADHPTHEMAQRVGYLFQNPDDQLFKATIREEVAFGPEQMGWDEAATQSAVEEALSLTGLSTLPDAHPYDLHPTRRRWVALASVLALRPPVLVLDEPTAGFDLEGQQRMAALLATLRAAGYTLLLISHDMQFVATHADTLCVMAAGQLLAQGSPETIFADEALLARSALAPPPTARLARTLGLPPHVVTPATFVAALREAGGISG